MRIDNFSEKLIYNLLVKDINKSIDQADSRHKRTIVLKDELNPNTDFGPLKDTILEFAKIFKKSFTEEQTKAMYYRLNRLKVVEKDLTIKKGQEDVQLGSYNAYYNRMTVNNFNDKRLSDIKKDTIFHELLHMASSKITEEGTLSGFESSSVGKAINEGFTEYMREKYFRPKVCNYIDSSDWRITVVKGLEYLVGAKEMENFYFSANLPGLIKALERYSSREEVIKLLFLIDRVETKDFSEKRYQRVIKEIARMNQNKLDYYFNRGVITPKQYDMMSALKVEEYKNGSIWSEQSRFVQDGDHFVITEANYVSPLYELKSKIRKNQQNYQI